MVSCVSQDRMQRDISHLGSVQPHLTTHESQSFEIFQQTKKSWSWKKIFGGSGWFSNVPMTSRDGRDVTAPSCRRLRNLPTLNNQ